MCKLKRTFLFTLSVIVVVKASDIFHVKSKITLRPDGMADYFGYSVITSEMGVFVGAPKAKSRIMNDSAPGAVFRCLINDLDDTDVTCYPLDLFKAQSNIKPEYLSDGMWFGATMISTADQDLVICAPLRVEHYQGTKFPTGACFVYSDGPKYRLLYFDDEKRPAYTLYGGNKNYGEYNKSFTYYSFAQTGMSMTYTKNDHLVIGAPGVLLWTGGTVDLKKTSISFASYNTFNPAYTKEIGPDEYFAYSVESGTFEVNGTVYYVAAAPRARNCYGQVLIYKPSAHETDPLDIKAMLRGPQMGAYFGAVLSTADIDGDGASDLLVGAPNYAVSLNGVLSYDQGAVIVYLSKKADSGFMLESAGIVRGSGKSGARFGSAIADLGDVDGDGLSDVAIGAPHEDEGVGVVYIYRGSRKGLMETYYQKIRESYAKGFGISISRGYDLDQNDCNDLAIGAYINETAYIYRCIPTVHVKSYIRLRKNANYYTPHFCINVQQKRPWSNVEIELKTTIIIENMGKITKKDKVVTVRPGQKDICEQDTIEIVLNNNQTKPIILHYILEPVVELDELSKFPARRGRISESSKLNSSEMFYLRADCGSDFVCEPWLKVDVEPLGKDFTYTPGSDSKLGASVQITNMAEPAMGVHVNMVLPCPPKRLPSSCSLDNLNMICLIPEPLERNDTVNLEIEWEYLWDGKAEELKMTVNLEDPVFQRNISAGAQDLVITITPQSKYDIAGKTGSNSVVTVTRETFIKGGDVFSTHYYEIDNYGPSDMYDVRTKMLLSNKVTPAEEIEWGILENSTLTIPPFVLPANTTKVFNIPLRFNLTHNGKLLENNSEWKLISTLFLSVKNGSIYENSMVEVATTLMLEPDSPIWPIIVGTLVGLLLLAAIIFTLHKFGFFTRQKHPEEKTTKNTSNDEPSSSQALLQS